MGTVQRGVGDVGEQDAPGAMGFKLSVHQVFRRVVRSDGLLQPAVRVGLTDRAEQFVFPHQTPYFLWIHSNSGVEQPHMDPPDAFIVAPEPVGVQDELEIRPVLFLPVLPHLFRLQPAVVSGSGNDGHFAQLGHGEDIALLGQRRPDDTEPKTGALHRYCPEPDSPGCRISFFKNAICCWRYTISF